MWRTILFACVALGSRAQVLSPDFFPLQQGNQWVLETGSAPKEILNIQVHQSRSIGEFTYFLVSGFASGDIWVRRAPGGELFARDMAAGSEEKIAQLSFGCALLQDKHERVPAGGATGGSEA